MDFPCDDFSNQKAIATTPNIRKTNIKYRRRTMTQDTAAAPAAARPTPPPTKALATWISTLSTASIPTDHITRAKYLILDGLTCALVGAHLPWSSTAVAAFTALEPTGGSCTLIGWESHTLSPLTAALLNSTFIQGFELDDYHSDAPLHSNSLLIPSLFAAIESSSAEKPFSGEAFLRAYITGLEVGPRVGLALHGKDLLTRGWHSGAIQGPSAVAAAVSNLWGLNAQQTEWALGMACTQAGGLMSAQFGSDVKRMQHGFAARNGLLGAVLARQGYSGIEGVFERSYGGFLEMFSQGVTVDERRNLPEELTMGLGSRWEIENVRVKVHAAMAGLHSTIDCVEKLQAGDKEQRFSGERLGEIEEVITEHGAAMYEHGGWIAPENEPLSSVAAQMSIQYAAAAQLLDGEVLMAFDADRLNRPEVRKLMKKVKPTHNKEFDKDKNGGFRTDVTVRFKDGKEVKTMVHAHRGIEPPVTNEEIVHKWRSLVRDVLSEERRDQIEEAVLSLDSLDDVTDLIRLLKSNVQCPIKVD